MKKTTTLLLILLASTVGFSQEGEKPDNTGDNFSLEGALALFKKSNSLEEFEKLLNEENNNVNNLDLNDDNDIDYIIVDDIREGDIHAIVLSTYIDDKEKQDIAIIGIEKTGNESATLQIEGDADLYVENTFIEPNEVVESSTGGKGGPSISEITTKQVIVNVWFWPSVRFLYAPTYVVWHSPWRWGFYPKWWRPWRPYKYHVFYNRCSPHRVHYHSVPARRVVVAHKIYAPRRNHSNLVIHNNRRTTVVKSNNRKTTVVTKNKRGEVKAVRVKKSNPNRVRTSGGRR
ncbi:hypothetical protein [Flavobacterium chungnamense]|uniref:DUF4252 domain-containing protein n=1 Tax=Flavobacterium chungnamense TaxID=706182 RepID=A0ABP7UFK3_9FLAO